MTQADTAIRKRATKACDQCRRRKTKCDGTANCAACRSINLNCSYGYHMRQARGPAYVAYLEAKVESLEDQIRRMSDVSPVTDVQSSQSSSIEIQPPAQSRPQAPTTPPASDSLFDDPLEKLAPLGHGTAWMQPADAKFGSFDPSFMSYPVTDAVKMPDIHPFLSQAALQLPRSTLNIQGSQLFRRRSIHHTLGDCLDMSWELANA